MTVITSFEFGPSFIIDSRDELEEYLTTTWGTRYKYDHNVIQKKKQGILSFDGDKAKAKNFIGFIQSEKQAIQIFPKVFREAKLDNSEVIKHLFYWFEYCRKWKFTFTDVNLSKLPDIDLPELIINLIANQIHSVISTNPISLYQDMEEAMLMPKGALNFNRYISNSMSKGYFHKLECDHQLLVFDNRLNRTIKYASRLLLNKSKFIETRQKIEEIIFILDEVEDQICQPSFLNQIPLSPFYQEYHTIIDFCRMVLEKHMYNHNYDNSKHWALLLPMEYVFEDFIAGFLERHFSKEWIVKYQKSDLYLTDENAFQMQHDIFLEYKKDKSVKIIVDTKYKLRGQYQEYKNKGIEQSDLYQMTAYAFRRNCNNVLLLYPNQTDSIESTDTFYITNMNQKIMIVAAEVPFWSTSGYQNINDKLYSCLETYLSTFLKEEI